MEVQPGQDKVSTRPYLKTNRTPVLLTHACNPSYSGGRDQENRGSKPAQANSL
jgi:hypothetical protein